MRKAGFYLTSKQLGFSVSLRNLPCFAGFIGALGWFFEMALRFGNQAAINEFASTIFCFFGASF